MDTEPLPSDVALEDTLRCTRCGNTWPAKDFYKHPTAATGRVSVCRFCIMVASEDDDPEAQAKRKQRREYHQKRMEEQKEMGRKWAKKYGPRRDR